MSLTKIKKTYTEKGLHYWLNHTVERPTTWTQNQQCWTTKLVLAFLAPFLPPLCLILPFHYSRKKTLFPHSIKEMKKKQIVYSKVDFTLSPKCGLMHTKKPNIYTQCSFLRKEQAGQTLSERGFLMDSAHWLNENYCIWEGTYLWFKA